MARHMKANIKANVPNITKFNSCQSTHTASTPLRKKKCMQYIGKVALPKLQTN